MKKLLSICFLSILLGLLSFSTQAQKSNDCCNGLWIENLQPETLTGVANAPEGILVLDNVLKNALDADAIGRTDFYELHFCPCGLDPKTKVSVDWLLYRDGVLVNENISAYADFEIYTRYNELNVAGSCPGIPWLGGIVPNNFGFCEAATGYCNTPTNYPGAMHVSQGTPNSVITNALTGETAPAIGMWPMYTQGLDYFYLDFFTSTRTIVKITWKQVGNYSLVMRIRQRDGGTPYTNQYWKRDEQGNLSQVDYVGGHQSCCGRVLAQDSIHYLMTGAFSKEVCENEPYSFGTIDDRCNQEVRTQLFTASTDTLVVFGNYDPARCCHFQVDSVYRFHFAQRNTPEVVVLNADTTFCKCVPFTQDDLRAMVDFDTLDFQYAFEHKLLWWNPFDNDPYDPIHYPNYGRWLETMPTVKTAVGTYKYYVRQENGYANYNKFGLNVKDTIHCMGDFVTLTVKIEEIEAPVLPDNADICLETIDSASVLTVISKHDPKCATTTRWYANKNWSGPTNLVFTGDTFNINLMQYAPTTNTDKDVYFYAVSFDGNNCQSAQYATYKISYHQTPVLTATPIDSLHCPGDVVTMKVKVNTNETNKPYTFVWDNYTTVNHVNPAAVPAALYQEVELGTNNKTNGKLPFDVNKYNNYCQQIYTDVPAGVITKMAFNYLSNANLTNKGNVDIYLTTTDKNAFVGKVNKKADFVTEGLVKVYSGPINATKGWNELTFTTPYEYDGTKNLVLVVDDRSDAKQSTTYFAATTTTGNMAMMISNDNAPINDPVNYAGSVSPLNYRSDVKFTVAPNGFTTNNDNQQAVKNLDSICGSQYTTSVYVIDANNCHSEPVEFKYMVKDTIAPVVSRPSATTVYNTCTATTFPVAYTTVEAFNASGLAVVSDNCDLIKISEVKDELLSTPDTACQLVVKRTYTFMDSCEKTVSFVHYLVGRDSVKPEFRTADGGFPYVQLFPVEGGNCTFNSPDSMEFVNAVRPFVYDNCTDTAYLMSTLKFLWENTSESPINAKDIFKKKNHLTVTATITDRCGNSATALVIYLDRPQHIAITAPSISGYEDVCINETATLVFDTNMIADDTILGPFKPYTYQWIEVNGSTAAHFTPVNEVETEINFDLPGDYTFAMIVTDRNGCSDTSEVVSLNVRALPDVVIRHVVRDIDGVPYDVEPYCPTYGDLTIVADVLNEVEGENYNYQWSGESVNVLPTIDSTFVTIVPDWCDTLYFPVVTVTDGRGCVGIGRDTVEVASNGPQVIGQLDDYTAQKAAGCKYYIPSFKDAIDETIIADDCYEFYQIKYSDAFATVERPNWYKQSPAKGTELKTASQVVTITIYTPCGDSVQTTVNVNKPDEVLAVSVLPTDTAACQEDLAEYGVYFDATVVNAVGNVTYEWELIDGEDDLTNNADAHFVIMDEMEAGVYTYQVNVKDALGCTASDQAVLTVYFQGADPQLSIWPNTLCNTPAGNGGLTVNHAPAGYGYLLQHDDYADFHFFKTSENPEHAPVQDYYTVAFGNLLPGFYTLTVYTTDGCERVHTDIEVPDNSAAPAKPTYTATDVTVCSNDNGAITINQVPGFSYELYHFDGDVIGELVGTGTTYEGLAVGKYYILATQNSTQCQNYNTVSLQDKAPRPEVKNGVVANTYCANNTNWNNNPDNVFNGQINITSNANWQYTVYTAANDTLLDNVTLTAANNPIKNLAPGTYYITAYNPTTTCKTLEPKKVTVGSNVPSSPAFSVNKTPNHFCATDTADGSITVTNYSSYRLLGLYKFVSLGTYDTIAHRVNDHSWNSLYQGSYLIEAIDNNYCRTTINPRVSLEQSTVYPTIAASSTINTSCVKDLGTITLKNNKSTANMVSYKIESGSFVKDSATTSNTVVFNNLATGSYTYTATTKFGCSVSGTISIRQYELPSMQLDSTPNHMCAPTFEKPGDGTVTVVRPVIGNPAGNHFFEYYFYDAADTNMEVPYELPLTNTMNWLAAKRYHVVAVDTVTGCQVEGYITVEDDLYEVSIASVNVTPTTYCSLTDGDGSLTINATSTNPAAEFNYSLDNETWQESNVFTGLANKKYGYYVKDVKSSCFVHDSVLIGYSDCRPDIDIVDNNNNHAPFEYCLDAQGVMLCANASYPEESSCEGEFSYHWYAPCTNPNSSDENCIDVNIQHPMPNGCEFTVTVTNTLTGCSYDSTVYVHVYATPIIGFVINQSQDTVANPANSIPFCENEPLHIEVVCTNGQTLVDNKTVWTLGYNGTGRNIDIVGTDYANDNITLCVYSESDKGCVSPIASLPLTFKRIDRNTVTMTECDGNCNILNENMLASTSITKPANKTYPYDTVVTRTYTSVLKGCDSVVTYNITLNGAPEVTPANVVVTPFCESAGYTLADFVDSFNIKWNGDKGDSIWMVGNDKYVLVNNINDLTDGTYIIAYNNNVMVSLTSNSANSFPAATVAPIVNNTITNNNSGYDWKVTKEGSSYRISNAGGDLYYPNGTSNSATAALKLATTSNISPATRALWTINMSSNGTATVRNEFSSNRYLKYNNNSTGNIFNCYTNSSQGMQNVKFYKKNYEEADETTVVDYEFATTHDVKYVVTNDCGSVEVPVNFTVYKQPVINSFVAGNGHCAGEMHAFKANVSTFGTAATAKLFIEGNNTPLATTTVNGLNQTVTFDEVKLPRAYNNKHIRMTVCNNCNPNCGEVSIDSILVVDTTYIDGLVLNKVYCVGEQMKETDFTGFDPSAYTSVKYYKMNGNTQVPDNDTQIQLPYTFTNRSMDSALVYVVAANKCFPRIISNVDTIFVNGAPIVSELDDLNICASAYATSLTAPSIDWNGSKEVSKGWLLKKANAYVPSSLNEIKDSAMCPKVAYAAYYAEGTCGSDTTFFTVNLMLPPTVSLVISSTQCPNTIVADAFTTNTIKSPCTALTSNVWTLTKADGSDPITNSNYSNVTFAYLKELGYDGGKITHTVANACGTATAYVTIDVIKYAYDTFKLQNACNNTTLDNFIIANTNAWRGTEDVVTSTYWSVNGNKVVPGNYTVNAADAPISVTYSYVTSCNDTVTTDPQDVSSYINDKPEVTVSADTTLCVGGIITKASAHLNVTFHGNADLYDTVWTLGGNTYDFNTPVTFADNGKYLIASIQEKVTGTTCGNSADTMVITVNPLPNPSITGPERACVDSNLLFKAGTGYVNYVFHVNGQDYNQGGDSTLHILAAMTGFGVAYDTVTVTVTDNNGCVGTSTGNAITKVTNAPEFIFRTMSGTETHNYTSTVGQGLQYTWEISSQCYGPDTLVYVEYDIYHNDTLIANNRIGEYINTATTNLNPVQGESSYYVTSNTFSWCATDGTSHTNTSYYNYSISDPNMEDFGNHFPNTNLGLGTGHRIFDDFWLSFLEGREVTKKIEPFRKHGEYKIVYRLMATSLNDPLEDFYSPTCTRINENIYMGAHNGMNIYATQTLLVTDSVIISVDGQDDNIAPQVVTPDLAPALVVDETSVAPEMEVWPNPAPAITTTFRARVHHMSGEATVTITSLAGRQIYNGEMNIDNDSYYFEASVNNLSVGTYIMTVRTADAIITKKVIVTR